MAFVTAMPSHRDRGVHPDAECYIVPDTGRSRGNYFSVYFYGRMEGRFPLLRDAKAFAETIYGPLPWKRVKGDQNAHYDPVWGSTTEFNDAKYFLVVDKLPMLGYASLQTTAASIDELVKAYNFYSGHGLNQGDAVAYAAEEEISDISRKLTEDGVRELVDRALASGGMKSHSVSFIDSGSAGGATVGAGYIKSGRDHMFVFNPRHLNEVNVLHECAHALSGGANTHRYQFYGKFQELLAQFSSGGQSFVSVYTGSRKRLLDHLNGRTAGVVGGQETSNLLERLADGYHKRHGQHQDSQGSEGIRGTGVKGGHGVSRDNGGARGSRDHPSGGVTSVITPRVAIDDETVSKSALISLRPPVSITRALMDSSNATEPLEDQHITLVYIPDKTIVDPEHLFEVVERWAAHATPLIGRTLEYGSFQNDNDVLYASWDFDDGHLWRNDLMAALSESGIEWEETYPVWVPHQTMSYLDAGTIMYYPPFPQDASLDIAYASLDVSYGGEVRTYPIGSGGFVLAGRNR